MQVNTVLCFISNRRFSSKITRKCQDCLILMQKMTWFCENSNVCVLMAWLKEECTIKEVAFLNFWTDEGKNKEENIFDLFRNKLLLLLFECVL